MNVKNWQVSKFAPIQKYLEVLVSVWLISLEIIKEHIISVSFA